MAIRGRNALASAGSVAAVAALTVAGVIAFVMSAVSVGGAHAQGGEPAIVVTGPEEQVKGGDEVPFQISVENVEDMVSFQFILQYRDDLFDFASAQRGEFLGSSGREVVCNEPVTDAGSVRYSCITLRAEPAGVDGSGHIATVMLKAKNSGTSEVTLDRVKLLSMDENAREIPGAGEGGATASEIAGVAVRGTTVDVASSSSTNWALWGGIAAAVAVVVAGGGGFAAMRMRNGAPNASGAPKAESST